MTAGMLSSARRWWYLVFTLPERSGGWRAGVPRVCFGLTAVRRRRIRVSNRIRFLLLMNVGLGGAALIAGCRNDAPPPQRVPVPAASNRDQLRERDYVKPMPDEVAVEPRPERPEPLQPEPRRDTAPPNT